jgi:hypothetical protein
MMGESFKRSLLEDQNVNTPVCKRRKNTEETPHGLLGTVLSAIDINMNMNGGVIIPEPPYLKLLPEVAGSARQSPKFIAFRPNGVAVGRSNLVMKQSVTPWMEITRICSSLEQDR